MFTKILAWALCLGCNTTPEATPAHTVEQIAPPTGFARIPLEEGSFGDWLRGLPLEPVGTPVRLWDGSESLNQRWHERVVKLSLLSRWQECADSVIRLRAEWAVQHGSFQFHGETLRYGMSRSAFEQALKGLFVTTGTHNLERELARPTDLRVGDVLVHGGSPGHAVLVMDEAVDPTGHRVVLIGNGFLPARSFYLVRTDGSPWHRVEDLATGLRVEPGYSFTWQHVRRF